jgi:DNA-binding NtrC family response regulator
MSTGPVAERRRVLVVDDDAEMRAMLRRALEGVGYAVTECERVDEVEEALATGPAHAVVLDKELPGQGGLDLLPGLRAAHPHLPVILVTAFGGAEVEHDARRLGATVYLEKPFRLGDLVGTLHQLGGARSVASGA